CGMTMQRLRQPAVLGYIVAGVILGPSGLGLVENRAFIQVLAELGVLMLLFLIAMEMSLRGIREVWKIAVFTTLIQIAAGLGVMWAIGEVLDWTTAHIVLLGFVVAVSSTAVAIKMLEDIGELRSRVGQITVGVLIAQDLAVVPMMLIVGSFRGGGSLDPLALVKVAGSIVFLALLIVYLSRRKRLHLPFSRLIGSNPDLMPLAGLAFCFGTAAITGLLGLSLAYGAFLAGLIVGNSTARRIMMRHTAPIQTVLLMIFFLSIGLLIDMRYIWDNVWTVLVILLFLTVFKTALNIAVIRLLGESWPRAFLSGVLLAQIGEFSFVLAALGLAVGAVSHEAQRLIVAVTVLSLMLGPLWLVSARRLHNIVLLGVTSARETLRLAYGKEAAFLFRPIRRDPSASMVEMASSATRWMGDIVPRSQGTPRGYNPDLQPGMGPPRRRDRR
ncbi:MAG: cation:proton antiporter, partial [Kiloniellales bacterium]|nr:cation:proton antiporter [Kiloniellales bacterium]